MATQIWVNIGSGNDLLPDGTRPLRAPTFNLSVRPSDNHLRAISLLVPQPSITKLVIDGWGTSSEIVLRWLSHSSWPMTCLKFHSNLPGTNVFHVNVLHPRQNVLCQQDRFQESWEYCDLSMAHTLLDTKWYAVVLAVAWLLCSLCIAGKDFNL